MSTPQTVDAATQKLAKWRKFFTSWQLGTRLDTDGEVRAVTHHREATILLRAELNALITLLGDKNLITAQEWSDYLEQAVKQLDRDYEEFYPGWRSTPDGMRLRMPEALETMRKLGFPP